MLGQHSETYQEGRETCASLGAILLPIKERQTYRFVMAWATDHQIQDIYIGMNFSRSLPTPLYSDGTTFTRGLSYEFDQEATKFGSKECVYLKKGIGYKPRSTDCGRSMNYFCLWRGPTCPEGYAVERAGDGRSCYGVVRSSPGPATSIQSVCSSQGNDMLRPAILSSRNIHHMFTPRSVPPSSHPQTAS